MSLMKSSNPVFTQKMWKDASYSYESSMSIQGTVNKTAISLLLVIASAYYVWTEFMSGANVNIYIPVGFIGGLIFALATTFKPNYAHITVPIYAILEGVALGALSSYIETMYPGLPMQAVFLTFGTFAVMLLAYKAGIIKATEKFRAVIVSAIGGIFAVYLISWIMSFFGVSSFLQGNSMFSIGFSVFVTAIAALSLILDFDFIEKGAMQQLPKQYEWIGAFGLLVTLIWLYIEILNLLLKISSRD
jgi:uncharacterized YccA/Bax inhibitor family protein